MFRTNVTVLFLLVLMFLSVLFIGCKDTGNVVNETNATNIIFLHHSTGHVIWKGQSKGISEWFGKNEALPDLFESYNENHGTNIRITEQNFPKAQPYGWNNYPYDYYNIWVQHAGNELYKEEPTLEMSYPNSPYPWENYPYDYWNLWINHACSNSDPDIACLDNLCAGYDVIIFKHCFPVGNIKEDSGNPDPASPEKSLENYKVQYEALKEKINSFPDTKFILWTAPANEKSNVTETEAMRTREFVDWVINHWDIPEDNIYLWDFYSLETEGGLYLKDEFAEKSGDSHPSSAFGKRVAPLLAARIVDVIENDGTSTNLKGEPQ